MTIKIIDPDLLNDGATDTGLTEVFINTATKRIKLNAVDNLGAEGVSLKALYSFLKEEWRNDPNTKNLAAFDFPMVPITDESFEFVSGWDLLDDTARYLIRDAGWTVKNTAGAVTQQWAGIIGLGNIENNDQLYYYQQISGGEPANVVQQGQVNQAVQIFRDDDGDGVTAEGSDFDKRTFFRIFGREQGQLYDVADLNDIGVAAFGPQAYRFPLGTGADLKITHTDVQIDANADNSADVAPYSGMTITYYAAPQARDIGGTSRNFGIIIDGNGGTAEQIYEFVQWSLRRPTDIDAGGGALIGKVADELLEFVGDTLKTKISTNPRGGGDGVFIDNYQPVDVNRLVFRDNTGTERTFPYNAVLTINIGDNLRLDASAKYWVYFTTLPGAGNDFGEAGALVVNDTSDAPMSGDIGGETQIQKLFAYDTNAQGGRTPGGDATITVVGIGLTTGQYVKATGTIGRSNANSVSLVAALERNYTNP